MATKTVFDPIHDDAVADGAPSVDNQPVVPNGKIVRIREIGWSCPPDCIAAVQWGSGGTFVTVRGGYGNMNISFARGKDFTGDGVKHFRLVRTNDSGASAVVVLWASAIIL